MTSQHKTICLQTGLLMILVSLAGCNSEPAPPTAVTPPENKEVVDESSDELDAPGQLELPSGDIPSPDAVPSPANEPKQSTGSGGLEMPSDADVSQSDPSPSKVSAARQTIRYAQWKEMEREITSSNQLTIVDIWSLSCQPCLAEFPGLVRLNREFGGKVRCISVDVDFDGRKTRPAESYEDRVVAFLAEVGATFPTYISETPSDEIFAELDLASIPAVLVYDANGILVKRFVDAGETAGFSYEADVIPFVKQIAG